MKARNLDEILYCLNNVPAEMARLMLLRSVEHKPKMLTHTVKEPDRTSPTSKKLSCSSSMVRESCLEPSPVLSRPNITPFPPGRKLITPPFDAIESIDLTGATGSLPSTSSITDSGVRLTSCSEDVATRKDPHEKRGIKRKSEEYTSSAMETRTPWKAKPPPAAGKASVRLLTDLNRIGCTPPVIAAEMSRRKSPNLPQNRDEEYEDDWLDIESVESVFLSVEKEPNARPSPICGLENQEGKQHQTSLPRSPCSGVVLQPSTEEKNSSSKEAQTKFMGSDSQEQDEIILNFLALSPGFFTQYKSSLKETMQANAELAYERLIGGRSAANLISMNKELVVQLHAIELLQKSREAYDDSVSQREVLKQNLMREISKGLNPITMPEELEKCRAVEAKLREINFTIRRLLPQVKIFDMDKDSAF